MPSLAVCPYDFGRKEESSGALDGVDSAYVVGEEGTSIYERLMTSCLLPCLLALCPASNYHTTHTTPTSTGHGFRCSRR